MADEEKIQADPEAISLVARQATGSMRDAISLLDQLASAGKSVTLQLAQDVLGTATSQAVIDVMEAMLKHQSAQGLEAIHRSLDSGSDPRQFARQIVDYLRSLLLVTMGNASHVEATAESRNQMAQHAQAFTVNELLGVIQSFNQAATETRSSWQPALPLEMAFVEAITPKDGTRSSPTAPGKPDRAAASQRVSQPENKPTNQKAAPKAGTPEIAEMSSADASANQK